MCKLHGERDVAGGGVDVTKGREILPANVIPKHYDLTLEPDFKKLTYKGMVVIDLHVAEDSTSISLNTLELDIHSTKILSGSQTIRLVRRDSGQFLNGCLDWSNSMTALPQMSPTTNPPKPRKSHSARHFPKDRRRSLR